MEERSAYFNNLKRELTTQQRLSHYNGNKENIVTTDAGYNDSTVTKTKQRWIETHFFVSRYLNSIEKKYSPGESNRNC